MNKKVVIVGAGEVGSHVARLLVQWGRNPVLVDREPSRPVAGAEIVRGDATDPEVLEAAGVRSADILAAVTGSDEVNLTVASLARFLFGVPRTLARVNIPRHAWMFTPDLGVDVALNQAEVMGHLIGEGASTGDMLTLLKLGGGRYSLIEAEVAAGAPAVGKALTALALPLECVLVGVLRQAELLLPRGPTVLQAGDRVLALAGQDHSEELRLLLEGER